MITLVDSSFWLNFAYFFLAVFSAFFVPGDLALTKLKLSIFQRIVLGTILGMVFWGWQGWILGFLDLRWLSYFYLLLVFVLWLRTNRASRLNLKIIPHFDLILIGLVFLGVLLQLSSIWFSGLLYKEGMYFCCSNLFDTILHLSYTNQLVKQFPPLEPGMSGVLVQNYHYWGNLVIAELIRVFRLPLIATQYQYSTVLISLFLGLTAIVFSQILNLGKIFSRWLVFFLYFGGDLIYFLIIVSGKGSFFSMSSLEDGARFLGNPPRAFAIVVFFAGLSLLALWIKRKDLFSGILMAIVFGSLVGFKIYVGIFVLVGLASLGIYYLLIKKDLKMMIPIILIPLLSLVIYLPVNTQAGGLYFLGLWRFEDFIVQPGLGLIRLELARRIYLEHHNWLRVAQQELIFISLYVLAIFGTKLFGLFQTKKSLSLIPKEINIFLISGIFVSAIAGFFFQQNVGGSNTFNFLVSVFIIGSVYTALACFYWGEKIKSKVKILFFLAVVILTIPRAINEGYLNVKRIVSMSEFMIKSSELEALSQLKQKTPKESLIQVDYHRFGIDAESPYVASLSDRQMFLSGMGDELTAHGIDFADRKKETDLLFATSDTKIVAGILLRNGINYLYMGVQDNLVATESAFFLKPVYKNQVVKILEFSPNLAKEYLQKFLLPLRK